MSNKKQSPDYIPVPIEDFVSGVKSPVRLYLKLSDDKFVLVAKKGSKPTTDQIKGYKERQVKYLWVQRDEYPALTKQQLSIAGIIVGKKDIAQNVKAKVLSAAANTVLSELGQIGLSEEGYQNAKQITEATMSLVEHHKDLYSLLKNLEMYNESFTKHSVAVSALAVHIAQEIGWENKSTLEKVSLGGLLHDIGLKALPPDLIRKPLAEMDTEELLLYQTHPFRGMEMLTSLNCVPDDIVSIVYEHEENSMGQGYPRRIRDFKIHPLAKVVGLADRFCELIMPTNEHGKAMSPQSACTFIEHTMGQPYNKEAFQALKKILGIKRKKSAA